MWVTRMGSGAVGVRFARVSTVGATLVARAPIALPAKAGPTPSLAPTFPPSQQRLDPQFLGHREDDVLRAAGQFVCAGGAPGVELLDHAAHQDFRG